MDMVMDGTRGLRGVVAAWGLVGLGLAGGCGGSVVADQGAGEEAGDALDVVPGVVESQVYDESLWRVVDDVVLPESGHPYANSTTQTWVAESRDCVQAVRVRFPRIDLKSGDSLTLYTLDNRRVQRITGQRTNFTSAAVDGKGLKVTLRTNGSGTGYGFKADQLQVVEGPVMCPAIAFRRCQPAEMTMYPGARAVCGCPRPPSCVDIRAFDSSLLTTGGFSGGTQGTAINGHGQVERIRRVTAGSPEERYVVATTSLNRLMELANQVQAQDFLRNPGASSTGNMTTALMARVDDSMATLTWPVGSQPASAHEIVAAFNKAATCGSDPDDARCADGFACQAGTCVEISTTCGCPRLYMPVCTVADVTHSNLCSAQCAGEEVRHPGRCGTAGDACGTLANLTCLDGFECEHDTSSWSGEPYLGQRGVCVEAGTSCNCPADMSPVCGMDHQTYSNPCEARCRGGVATKHDGPCGTTGDPCGGGQLCFMGHHCQAPGGETVNPTGDVAGTCVEDATCTCTQEFAPVCASGWVTYSNPCEADCARATLLHPGACGTVHGDLCGQHRGLLCGDGMTCRYPDGLSTPPYPEATGTCVPVGWCDTPLDCGHNVRLACPATWFCEQNACRFECNAPVERWVRTEARFETAHPYANNESRGWRATGLEGATAVRFVFQGFDTEQGYDFAILHDEGWNEVTRYSGSLGGFTTVEVPGRVAFLVFKSDASVVRSGFVGVAVESKVP
jgi:hypothetical protein